MTNCPCVARVLEKLCRNGIYGYEHSHFPLIGGIAKLAAKYPPRLVAAVLRAIKQQLLIDCGNVKLLEQHLSLNLVGTLIHVHSNNKEETPNNLFTQSVELLSGEVPEEPEDDLELHELLLELCADGVSFWDDVRGGWLDSKLVRYQLQLASRHGQWLVLARFFRT